MGRHNCPLNVALSEVKHLWPSVADPDAVITLGTGSELASPRLSRFRNIVVDGWIPRVYRSLKNSFDGQTTWKEVKMRLHDDVQEGYFRFDEYLSDGLPAIDDTKCMDSLTAQTRMQSGRYHEEAALTLLTTCLYFRLDTLPEYRTGLYYCTGTIRCRIRSRALIKRLDTIPGNKDIFKDNHNLGLQLSTDDICGVCQRYSLPVRFFVRDLEENFILSLRLGSTKRRLSAFPRKIQWFIDEQKLDCPFGTSNHSIPFRVDCPACDTRTRTRGQKRKYMDI